jgi:hypothetical protein
MKKKVKRLVLAKETLTLLSNAGIWQAKGGSIMVTDMGCDSHEIVVENSACPKMCP